MKILIVLLMFLLSYISGAQGNFVVKNKKKNQKINFKLIHNLIIIPVNINGVTLSFLLDTGVTKPIIFNYLSVSDTLKIKNTETIFLRGLGEGEPIKALKSENNVFKIGDAIKLKQELYAIFDSNLNFTPRLGIPVHGIIGYDLFKDFVIEINYSKKYLKLTNPEAYTYKKCRKCEVLDLEFHNKKPYLNAEVLINKDKIPVKLLIDSGGSDSLWLFEDDSLDIKCDDVYFEDFLGFGLSGSVYGKRSTIDGLFLKKFEINRSNVAYPDKSTVLIAKRVKDRNGSISGNILKRFNIIFDYNNSKVTMKRNSLFKEKFSYNKSGIELEHNGLRLVKEKDNSFFDKDDVLNDDTFNRSKIIINTKYKLSLKPAYTIVELRNGSPAHRAGLLVGDVIYTINGRDSHNYKLQEVIQKFYDDDGKRIKLKVDRAGKLLEFIFNLESPLKKNIP